MAYYVLRGVGWGGDGRFQVGAKVRKLKLRRMDADDGQPFAGVPLMPLHQIGQGAYTVNAGVIPKINQHYLTAQLGLG